MNCKSLTVFLFLLSVSSAAAQPIEATEGLFTDRSVCAQSLGDFKGFRLRYSWSVTPLDLNLTDSQRVDLVSAIDRTQPFIGGEPAPTPTSPDLPTVAELAKQEIEGLLTPLKLRVLIKRGKRTIATCKPNSKAIQVSQYTSTDQSGVTTRYSVISLPAASPDTKGSHRCRNSSGKLVTLVPKLRDTVSLVQSTSDVITSATFLRCPVKGCKSNFFCGVG
jgi:hypothetical protein